MKRTGPARLGYRRAFHQAVSSGWVRNTFWGRAALGGSASLRSLYHSLPKHPGRDLDRALRADFCCLGAALPLCWEAGLGRTGWLGTWRLWDPPGKRLRWWHLPGRGSQEPTLGCSPPREAAAQECGALRCGLGSDFSPLGKQQRSPAASLRLLRLVCWTPAQLLLCRRECLPADLPCQRLHHRNLLCPLLSAQFYLSPRFAQGLGLQLGHVLAI